MLKNLHVYEGTDETSVALLTLVGDERIAERVAEMRLQEPEATSWRSLGFVRPRAFGELDVFVSGQFNLFVVGIAERVLPSAVIDQAVKVKAAELEKKEQRRVNRTERAVIKEEVVSELLPKSHIKHTSVTVVTGRGQLWVDTSSAQMADRIVMLMREMMGTEGNLVVAPLGRGADANKLLRDLAYDWERNVSVVGVDGRKRLDKFSAYDSIAFKGEKTIRVKGIDDFDDVEVTTHLSSSDSNPVIEMGVAWSEDSADTDLTFALNEACVIKRIKFSDVIGRSLEREKGDDGDAARLDANAYLSLTTFYAMIMSLKAYLAEYASKEKPKDKPAAQGVIHDLPAEEDDEL